MKSRIMYIELKSNQSDKGPARIGRVTFSQTGKTIYYCGKRFRRIKGGGYSNYYDLDATRDEYWISGCKKNGQDRHWAGSGPVEIDEDVREEYWTQVRGQPENSHKATLAHKNRPGFPGLSSP